MSTLPKVLITGAGGQVGRALLAAAPSHWQVCGATHAELDIADRVQVAERLAEVSPALVINAAAYTAVDQAEAEPECAHRGNAEGPANLAECAVQQGGIRLIHLSTDFVFDGRSSTPYKPSDPTGPLSVYGATKLAGEQAVLRANVANIVLRTAWVYAAQGQNFLKTMLRVMKERGAVRVVADQVGSPTAAQSLADVLWRFADRPALQGVFHWTDAGVASWYDFAVAIAEEAQVRGLLAPGVTVEPIATAEYPTRAQRPAFSVLDKIATLDALGIRAVHWRDRLRQVLEELSVA